MSNNRKVLFELKVYDDGHAHLDSHGNNVNPVAALAALNGAMGNVLQDMIAKEKEAMMAAMGAELDD